MPQQPRPLLPHAGSDLSNGDSESEGVAAEEDGDELEGSFLVADGYLSEDEGVRLDEEEGEGMEVDQQMAAGK
jgi:hypothetical protein